MKKAQLLKDAANAFMKREFLKALELYEQILSIEPQDNEAKLGVMLCDLASEDEEEAVALFDFYIILKEEKELNAEERVLEMIETLDSAQSMIEEVVEGAEKFEDAISYKDFQIIVKNRGSFKRAFEDIMFSTKVVITQKRDFFEFLDNLIENGFTEMVYSYLEDATKLYPTDTKIREFFDKLHREKI